MKGYKGTRGKPMGHKKTNAGRKDIPGISERRQGTNGSYKGTKGEPMEIATAQEGHEWRTQETTWTPMKATNALQGQRWKRQGSQWKSSRH